MPRDAVSRTAHVGTVGKNGFMRLLQICQCEKSVREMEIDWWRAGAYSALFTKACTDPKPNQLP